MTSSLTACLKKAGDLIAPADRAAILARSRDLRGEGQSAHAAAKQAVSERLELVKTELNQAVRATLKKAPAANERDAFDADMRHRAFHGTPHDFDRFSIDKIGTGEGAQAYGHGLYFAENQAVAEDYKRKLTLMQPAAFDGAGATLTNAEKAANTALANHGWDKQKALASLENERPRHSDVDRQAFEDEWNAKVREAVSRWSKNTGRLYQVDIPDEVVARMLLWDKPLSAQSEKVQDAVAKLNRPTSLLEVLADKTIPQLIKWVNGFDRNNSFDEMVEEDPSLTADDVRAAIISSYDEEDMAEYLGSPRFDPARTGESIYRELSSKLGGDAAASKAMDEAGVPGIRYLDGGSRNRPLKQVKREFLAQLPEDADFNEVLDLIGSGTFSPENEAILKALAENDWLGFDYPSQAISAALSPDLANYDASDALVKAVEEAQKDATYNLVVFNDKNVTITHKDGSPVTKAERDAFMEDARGRGDTAARRRSDQTPDSAAAEADRAIRTARAPRRSEVQRIVDDLTASWKDKPQITVVESVDELDGDHPADTRGLYSRGHVWIVAGAPEHRTRAGIARTLAHEAIAHHGLRNMLGREAWNRLMRDIQLGIRSKNKALLGLQKEVRKAYIDEDGNFELSEAEEADEIAAKAVEEAIDADGNFRPGFAFLKAVFARVAQFLRERGIDVTFTNAELQGMLVLSMRNMERGQRTAGGGRMVLGGSPAARARDNVLSAISKVDRLFRQPKSEKDTVAEIAAEVDPAIQVKLVAKGTLNTVYSLTMPDGKKAKLNVRKPNPYGAQAYGMMERGDGEMEAITERPGTNPEAVDPDMEDVYVDVSALKEGGGGSLVYTIAATFAHNTGRIFIGDPADLSDAALRRRTEQMLSSALKFGTTRHIAPHPRQVEGDRKLGVPGMRWTYGQDLANIESLVQTSLAAFDYAEPNPLTFEPSTGRFVDRSGAELDDGAISRLVGEGAGREARAGVATLKRNAILRALLPAGGTDASARGRSLLEGLLDVAGQPGAPADRVFYARGVEPSQTETPAFKRWFGDSKVVDAEGKPLVVYHGTTADLSAFDLAFSGSDGVAYDRPAIFATDDARVASDYARNKRNRNIADAGRAFQRFKNENPGVYDEEYERLFEAYKAAGRKEGWDIGIGANVLPLYLSIQNPLEVDGGGQRFMQVMPDAVKQASAEGRDGVIVRSVIDHASPASEYPVTIYVAFKPEQAKSAIGNRGTFDAFDADIRHARGGTAAANPAPAAPAPATPNPTSPWRDATGRLQFAPGAWLYEQIGNAAGPLLTKLQMKAASPELKRMLREMKLQVAKAQETAGAVATEAMKLSEDERAMVSDIVEQELAAGTIPPAHALRLAAMINSTMGAQTDELVRLGMLTEDSADMWRGKYLPRYYKNKLGKQVGDAWADAVGKMFGRTRTMAGIKGKHLRGRGLYESVQASEVAEWESLGWEVRDPDYPAGTGAEISQKILSGDLAPEDTVQVWRDFTREERENMGEIRDAGFRFVLGYMQTQRDIALGRLFEELADNAEMSAKKETAEFTIRVPDGTVTGTGAKRYGKLAGRWVSKDTFSHLTQIEESQSEAWKMYRKALALWKEGKVALNPVSHVNNMVSNLTMAHFAGVSYLRADKYIAAAKDFAMKSAGIQEAKDAGLFLGTMSDAELMNVLPEDLKALMRNQMSAAERFTVDNNKLSAFNIMTFWLRKPMGWAYQAEDTFFRYLIYKDARGRGMEPGDAVDYAQKFIFAYDDLPKGARMVRDFGIPFFAYTYKAVPALLHTALTHPIRMAAPAAVLWGINAAAYAIAAGDDEDDWLDTLQKYINDPEFRARAREKEKLEREHLPEWMKGSTSLGTPKAIRLGMDEVTKLPLFIDTSRIVPGGDLFDVNPNGGGIPWIQPLTPSNPLLTTYMAMFGNRDAWFGKEVVDGNDTRGEAAAKRAEWLWKQASPAVAFGNYHFERGMNALAQATGQEIRWAPEAVAPNAVVTGMGRDGLPVQPKLAAMQTFGIKVRPIDLETSEAIDNSLKQKLIRDIDTEMRRLRRLSGKGAISDQVYEREFDKAQEKKDRLRSGLTVDGDEKN
jgi:hypothetical protein